VSSDEFYDEGFYDGDAPGYGDEEPQVAEDLSRRELDQHARDIYGLDNWDEVEAQWQREDEQKEAEHQAEQEAQLVQQYSLERLGEITRGAVSETGVGDTNVPGVHEVAGRLLADRDWRRDHQHLEAEPLVAAAIRDGLKALNVGQARDENEALSRYLIRMQTRGG
jgi:hypothetical protein